MGEPVARMRSCAAADVAGVPKMMLRRTALSVSLLALAGCASAPPPPDATQTLRRAEQALGSANVKTLALSGRGSGGTFGQAYRADTLWPALNYSQLTRVFDFENGAFREDFARSRGEPTGGGATPLMGQGEARASAFSRESFAWNGGANAATPAPVALDARIHDLWTSTPHGAIQAARRFNATAGTQTVDGQALTALAFTVPNRLRATVYVDAAGLVPRIDSTLSNAVAGDTAVVTRFADYRDAGGGVLFPMKITQSQGGGSVLDIAVAEVKLNVPAGISVPDNVRAAKENVAVDKVAEGVWLLGGGSHNSVAVELADRIVLIESPLYDGRAAAVFTAANALVSGKRVQTVVNSHHHFDHAGGLRYAAGEGATLVTSAIAKPYFERAFANPNRVNPDRLAASGRTPQITGVSGKHVIGDAMRTIEIHEIQGSVHAQGFLMAWLPKEKLLVQADAYTPAPPNSPPPPAPNANNVNLVQNLERLGLQPERIVPLHGRVVPMSELAAAIGRGR
jgi:glyoxylase-like metal-dependent hydrolase (beta-lactamase superfamily II)